MANQVAISKGDYQTKIGAAPVNDTVEFEGVTATKLANRIDREKNALWSGTEVSADYTAVRNGERIIVDTTGGPVTITLPVQLNQVRVGRRGPNPVIVVSSVTVDGDITGASINLDGKVLDVFKKTNVFETFTWEEPADVVAPILSAPTGTQTGDNTADLTVTTDEGDGLLYFSITTTATPPSAAQVKAGQDNTGATAALSGVQAVSGTGVQNVSLTGLSAGTTYYAHLMHEDTVQNASAVSTTASFTTTGTGTDANVTAIAADGWQATYTTPPAEMDPVGDPKAIIVQRSGFDAAGDAAVVQDTLLLTKRVRQPHPNQASLTTDSVALQHFVYASDTIVGGSSPTNNSALAYPLPQAMWLNHDLEHVTTTSHTVRLAVSHMFARDGRPVASVRFIATDESLNTVQVTVSTMSVSSYTASTLSVPHFAGVLDLTGLNAGELVTVNAIIFPWVGTSFDISTDADTYPSPNLTVLKFLNDKDDSYGTVYAYVDGVGGSPAVHETPATAQTTPYDTIANASAGLQTYINTNFSRNNVAGGIIRLEDGTHVHANYSARASGDIPMVIEAVGSAAVYEDAGATVSDGIPDTLKLKGLTLRQTAASVIFLDSAATIDMTHLLVMEDCTFDLNGQTQYDAWIYRTGRMAMINCSGDDCGQASPFSNVSKTLNSIGCNTSSVGRIAYNAAGCKDLATIFADIESTVGRPKAIGRFLGFNFLSNGAASPVVELGKDNTIGAEAIIDSRGFGVVGNVIERTTLDTSPTMSISADTAVEAAANVINMMNTKVGARTNYLYQDEGTANVNKVGVMRFSINNEYNTKTDVFGTPSGNRVGNWSVIYKVGFSANTYMRGDSKIDVYGAGEWLGEVAAIGDVAGTNAAPIAANFTNDQSFVGGDGGDGNYQPTVGHALSSIPAGEAPYSHDLLGQAVPNDGSANCGAIQE